MQAIASDFQGYPLMHIVVLPLEDHFLAVKGCVKDPRHATLIIVEHLILLLWIAVANHPDVVRLFVRVASADYDKGIVQPLDGRKALDRGIHALQEPAVIHGVFPCSNEWFERG